MGHADFRAAGKIFASLPPRRRGTAGVGGGGGDIGMVRLSPERQRAMMLEHPGVFEPAAGAWGRSGCTYVALAAASPQLVKRALETAWENTVPKRAAEDLGGKKRTPGPKSSAAARRPRAGARTTGGSGGVKVGLRRVYEEPAKGDGTRILVERLWPRGLTKARAGVDVWLKEVAPSPALRAWYGHDAAKWQEFRRRYRAELAANADAVEELRRLAREGPVTLVYAASDEVRNSAAVLREFLRGAGGRVSADAAPRAQRPRPRGGARPARGRG